MSCSNLRIIGANISRMVARSGAATKLAPAAIASTIRRYDPRASARCDQDLHNRPKTANQQMQVVGSSVMPEQFAPLSSESAFKLDEVKVFQDEQIIQLAFKSGQSVNYNMSWLRNLCSCPNCVSNKFQHSPTHSGIKSASLVEGPLSIARFSSTEDELLIEWLDCNSYKSHTSIYNLQYLSMYASSRNN